MNQEKIGIFILENRKKKKLTQQELAKKLGITNRTISNWENGKYLPDYNLLIPLTKELDISVSELITGEYEETKLEQKKTVEKFIDFLKHIEKIKQKKYKKIGLTTFIIGLIIIILILLFMPSNSIGNRTYIELGFLISIISLLYITHREKVYKIILINTSFIMLLVSFLLYQDYISVKYFKFPPRYYVGFSYQRIFTGHVYYETPLYDVYACEENMYKSEIGKNYIITKKNKNKTANEKIKEYCNLKH